MKKALIITYYFPPFNGVPGWRPYSWHKYFRENNFQTTVITRNWDGNEKSWEDAVSESKKNIFIEGDQENKIIRLPYTYSLKKKLSDNRLFKISGISSLLHLFFQLSGSLNLEIDTHHAFKNYIRQHLKNNKYDVILVSSPPLNLIKLGAELSEEFKIPFVADLRDLWNNDEMKDDASLSLRTKIQMKISRFYLKRWLKNAEFCTTVSQPLAKKIKPLISCEIFEITNGYEEEFFTAEKRKLKNNEAFTVSVIGSLYPQQNLSILIDGLNLFLKSKKENRVKINFIGIEIIKSVTEQLKSNLPKQFIFTSARIPREKAIEYTLGANVLLHAGWKGYHGIQTGKIFDYLGARKNILIAPGDEDVLDEIVKKTNSGKIANTKEEFYLPLQQWYEEWEIKGVLDYHGNEEVINSYSRENQAKRLAELIRSKLKDT